MCVLTWSAVDLVQLGHVLRVHTAGSEPVCAGLNCLNVDPGRTAAEEVRCVSMGTEVRAVQMFPGLESVVWEPGPPTSSLEPSDGRSHIVERSLGQQLAVGLNMKPAQH